MSHWLGRNWLWSVNYFNLNPILSRTFFLCLLRGEFLGPKLNVQSCFIFLLLTIIDIWSKSEAFKNGEKSFSHNLMDMITISLSAVQFLWCYNQFREFGIGSINDPLIDILLFSLSHLSVRYCIDIVRINSFLVTYES